MAFKDQINDTELSTSSSRLKFDIAKTVAIIKVHINIIITSIATHCADVLLPGRCLPKMAPTPLKMRPWAGFYFIFLFVLATQNCNSALGAFTGIAGYIKVTLSTSMPAYICFRFIF